MSTTLYWHDYETFGVDPRRDRPAQFAGLRTDEALNEVGDPLVIYCKPARDMLPHSEACLLTGITPQLADAKGVLEPEFIGRIHAELAQPGTCGVGYNTFLHASRMYSAETGCTTLIMPLVGELGNNNSALVYDLRHDPGPFMGLDQDGLRDRLFTRAEDLPEGVERLPVKSVKINKCPALAPQKTLDAAAAERIAIDLTACTRHWELLSANEGFMQRVAQAYSSRKFSPAGDVDLALYEGFLNDADRPLLANVRGASPQELAQTHFDFHDERLPELLFRYRARNWPETLSVEEAQRWEYFRRYRLQDEDGGGSIVLKHYNERIALLRNEHDGDADAQRILDAMDDWGEGMI